MNQSFGDGKQLPESGSSALGSKASPILKDEITQPAFAQEVDFVIDHYPSNEVRHSVLANNSEQNLSFCNDEQFQKE